MADQQCKLMRSQLVDAFMAGDWPRYQEALFWLRDHVAQEKARRGRLRRGMRWYDPDVYGQWLRNLRRARGLPVSTHGDHPS